MGLKSDVVLTMTPDGDSLVEEQDQQSQFGSNSSTSAGLPSFPHINIPLRISNSAQAVALKSWTDADIDVWVSDTLH